MSPLKDFGRLFKSVSEIFKTAGQREDIHLGLPARLASDPTSSHPFSILHPLRESHVTFVPDNQVMSVHALPVKSTRVTLASMSAGGGKGKVLCDHTKATESRIALGLKRAGSVLSMTLGLNREGPDEAGS